MASLPIALAFGVLELPGATPTSLSLVLAAQAVPAGDHAADRRGGRRPPVGRARVIAITDIDAERGGLHRGSPVPRPAPRRSRCSSDLSFLMGLLNGLWWPAMSGLVPEVMGDDENLQPANAYISVASNARPHPRATRSGGLLVAGFGSRHRDRHRRCHLPRRGHPGVHLPARVDSA
jgi:hypothetical protein